MTGGWLAGSLVTFALQSTLLLGAIALLHRTDLFRDPRARDASWKAGLVAAVLLLLVSAGMSASVGDRGPGDVAVVRKAFRQQAALVPGQPVSGYREILGEEVQLLSDRDVSEACRTELRSRMRSPSEQADRILAACVDRPSSLPATLEWLWLFGALVTGGWMIARRVRVRGAVGRVAPIGDARALRALARVVARSRYDGRLELVEAVGLRSPAVLGLHTVALPSGYWTELPDGELEAVLAHEVAHLHRRDPHWMLGLDLLQSLLWFQPLLGTARRGLRESGEWLCDASAVRWTERPLDLARSLMRVGEWVAGWGHPSPELGVARSQGASLSDRVRRILRPAPQADAIRWGWAVAAFVVAAGAAGAVPAVHFDPGAHVDVQIRTVQVDGPGI